VSYIPNFGDLTASPSKDAISLASREICERGCGGCASPEENVVASQKFGVCDNTPCLINLLDGHGPICMITKTESLCARPRVLYYKTNYSFYLKSLFSINQKYIVHNFFFTCNTLSNRLKMRMVCR
jgi:hypothetical protein